MPQYRPAARKHHFCLVLGVGAVDEQAGAAARFSVTHGEGDNARRLLTGLLWGFCATAVALQLIRLASLSFSRPAPHAGR